MNRSMKYIGEEEREVPQHGVFKPGNVVDFNESLYNTGLFHVDESKTLKKDGEE